MRIIQLLPDAVTWREVEGEIVAIDLKRATYFTLSNSAASLWPLLERGADEQTLAAQLIADYGLDAAAAGRDVTRFVTDLHDRGLVSIS